MDRLACLILVLDVELVQPLIVAKLKEGQCYFDVVALYFYDTLVTAVRDSECVLGGDRIAVHELFQLVDDIGQFYASTTPRLLLFRGRRFLHRHLVPSRFQV